MAKDSNDGKNSLQFIAEKLNDLCVESQCSNLSNIQIISEQVSDALSELYQQTKQLQLSLRAYTKRLQRLVYLYLLNKQSSQIYTFNCIALFQFNSVVFFQRCLKSLEQNLDITKFKSIKNTYQTIRNSNNSVALFPKLQSINHLQA